MSDVQARLQDVVRAAQYYGWVECVRFLTSVLERRWTDANLFQVLVETKIETKETFDRWMNQR